ncbi:hypothetical protein JJV70_04265 [Streptomyces sp. JJ66]|uniref:DUF3592 domain-containing protein n=1 Tax=Streptomyces sp. JJ66 TaxID=2803843 RepID=UPI001C58DDA0|nr:DUF3592 domain-containing protein [Streptomyces sp. JJ66]MBW1601329.1 hypothetical protein [Streptomyces sp. JJ66]
MLIIALIVLGLASFCLYKAVRESQLAHMRRVLNMRGLRTVGVCVNLRWTSNGAVSSVIQYHDAKGSPRYTSTEPERSVRVPVGVSVEISYDRLNRVPAVLTASPPGPVEYGFAVLYGIGFLFFGYLGFSALGAIP